MTIRSAWYDVSLDDRWTSQDNGWRASVPEFAWAAPCPTLRLLGGDTEVSGLRHDHDTLWIANPGDWSPRDEGRKLIATLPRCTAEVPGHVRLMLGDITGLFVPSRYGWVARMAEFRSFHHVPWGNDGSPLVVLEDGVPLGRPWHSVTAMDEGPGWLHARDGSIYVVTADGSDPNSNGRRYTLAVTSLEDWPVPVLQWPANGPFRNLENGVALPVYASLGLTNKCNLRCAICGSQSHLDRRKEARRFMDIAHVRAVAATTFPFLREVELNSYGEPTLHPDFAEIIDQINRHHCLIKLQTNATLLRPAVIDGLVRAAGFVMMSIDAVGLLFETARHLGRWSDVEAGVRELMRRRDPARLRVGLYPTVTRTTLPGMLDVLEWAHDLGMEFVNYHLYEPIIDGSEERPSAEEVAEQEERLRLWLERHPGAPDVQLNLKWLKLEQRAAAPDPYGKVVPRFYPSHPVPATDAAAHPSHACQAPWQQLDFGLDGEFYACCRAQRTPLGRADTPGELCDAWFGANYESLRNSLRRDKLSADVLPPCGACVRAFGLTPRPPAHLPKGSIILSPPFAQEGDHAFLAALTDLFPSQGDSSDAPKRSSWRLFEDKHPLGPAHTPHNHIRALGKGAFSHWGAQVYFSSSDNTDPNTNGRTYTLRPAARRRIDWISPLLGLLRRPSAPAHLSLRKLDQPFLHVDGHCWMVAELVEFGLGDHPGAPNSSPLTLYEDGRPLGPMHTAHADIAVQGAGSFSHWERGLWFSTSDNSDPNTNGRVYEVRIDLDTFFAAHARKAVSIVKGWLEALPGGMTTMAGATVLEIGPGPDMGTLVLLAALGARRVMAVERSLPPWRRDWHPHLMVALAREAAKSGLPTNPSVFERAAQRGPKAVGITPLGCGIEALPPDLAGCADVVVSHSVLEHLEQVAESFAHMAQACRPAAYGIHDVDFRDHRNFGRPLEFLVVEDTAWLEENGDYRFRHGNRVRLPEMLDLLSAVGFTVLAVDITDTVDATYMGDFLPRLRASGTRHAQTPEDHLTTASARLLIQGRPDN